MQDVRFFIYICACICVWEYANVAIFTCESVCMYERQCVCMNVSVYV